MTQKPRRVRAVFVGAIRDGGFNDCALAGVSAAGSLPGITMDAPITAPYDAGAMGHALGEAATSVGPGGLVIFIGGQGDRIVPRAASAHHDRSFAVVQGSVSGKNLASYHVRQDDSAWLAGVLAGRISRTGVVGHLSGHRVAPGLRGRAAFAAGVRHAAPDATLLTSFCGAQDDVARAEAWTSALIDRGADPIFTMLNAGRQGATAACRARGVRQIGNASDWVATDPATYVASAVARIDFAVLAAVEDPEPAAAIREYGAGHHRHGQPYVALAMRADVDAATRGALDEADAALAAGRVAPWPDYDGPEFVREAVA